MVALGLTGRGTFHVKNYRRPRIDLLGRHISARLDQHFVSAIAQFRNKREHIFLSQRLTSCDLDQTATECLQLRENTLEAYLLTAVKRVLAIAPYTPHRAARQPNERARTARVRRLALYRKKDLGDAKVHEGHRLAQAATDFSVRLTFAGVCDRIQQRELM